MTVEDEPEGEDAPAARGGTATIERSLRSRRGDRARDKKCSTPYVQRRFSVGYNKAASLVERMEKEGVVGAVNDAGKRAILVGAAWTVGRPTRRIETRALKDRPHHSDLPRRAVRALGPDRFSGAGSAARRPRADDDVRGPRAFPGPCPA